jgi:hypothetical protein
MTEQHGDQRDADQPEHRPDDDRLLVVVVIDPYDDEEEEQAEHRPRQLLRQEEVRLVIAVHREHRGGAVDHHHARAHEQQRGGEEEFVRLKLSGHDPNELAAPKPATARRAKARLKSSRARTETSRDTQRAAARACPELHDAGPAAPPNTRSSATITTIVWNAVSGQQSSASPG